MPYIISPQARFACALRSLRTDKRCLERLGLCISLHSTAILV